jgi:hypothetical protein
MNTRKRNKTVLLLAIMVMIWLGSVVNADLISYWQFDEGTGTTAYDAASENNGQFVGTPTWIEPGKIGAGALYFPGGGGYVTCGTDVTTAPDLSVALWLKADAFGHQAFITTGGVPTGGYSTDPGWLLALRGTPEAGSVWCRIHGTGGAWDGGDVHIENDGDILAYYPGRWVHMAYTYDSSTLTLKGYINGQLRGEGTVVEGRSVATTDLDFRIGEQFTGILDDLAFWDNVLTAEEIWTVYGMGVLADANTPYVNAGSDMITVSDVSVDMAPTVINNDTQDPNRPLAFKWTAIPSAGVVISDPCILNPTVTITDPAPNNPTTYTMVLSAQLVNPVPPHEIPNGRSMTIDVYSDACKAKIAAEQAMTSIYDPGDFNTDCTTELKDFGQLAEKWLENYELDAPAVKP